MHKSAAQYLTDLADLFRGAEKRECGPVAS